MTEPKLSLSILDTHNENTLLLADSSQYPTKFVITSPTIQVKVPGYPESSLPFDPGNMMVFTSVSLGLTCNSDDCLFPLPDGLYRFIYTIAPAYQYKTEKFFLRTDSFYAKFDLAFLKAAGQPHGLSPKDRIALDEIEAYIEAAIVAANQCNQKLAVEWYTKGSSALDQFITDNCY